MDNMTGNDMNRDHQNLGNARLGEGNVRDNNMVNNSMSHENEKDKVLVGIFGNENEAINVINRLKETGYHENEITVLAKDKKQMDRIDETTNVSTKTQNSDEKVGAGVTIGAVAGGIAAALPALGLLIIPGIGPFLAAGPIAIILGGVVAGGVAGGLVGVLVQLGVNEEDAKQYEYDIKQGKILVLVEKRENLSEDVQNTFRQNNNMNVDRTQH